MQRPDGLGGHGWLYLTMGIIAMAGGVFALANPFVASIVVLQIVAAVFVVLGILQIAFTLRSPFGLSWFDLAMGALQILLGVLLVSDVLGGLVSLTLVVAIALLVEGIVLVMAGINLRAFSPWLWLVLAGAVSIVLAVLVLAGLPGTAETLLGVLLGIDLISNGVWLIFVGVVLRRM